MICTAQNQTDWINNWTVKAERKYQLATKSNCIFFFRSFIVLQIFFHAKIILMWNSRIQQFIFIQKSLAKDFEFGVNDVQIKLCPLDEENKNSLS